MSLCYDVNTKYSAECFHRPGTASSAHLFQWCLLKGRWSLLRVKLCSQALPFLNLFLTNCEVLKIILANYSLEMVFQHFEIEKVRVLAKCGSHALSSSKSCIRNRLRLNVEKENNGKTNGFQQTKRVRAKDC